MNSIKIDVSKSNLKSFGLILSAILTVFGSYKYFNGFTQYIYFIILGLVIGAISFIYPKLLKPVYVPWIKAALFIGNIVSKIILTILYILVVSPIGIIFKLTGKQFLSIKDPGTVTYWIKREGRDDKKSLERQF